MKQYGFIALFFLLVAVLNFAALAQPVLPSEQATPEPPEIFRAIFKGDDRARALDAAFMNFNNRISAEIEPYYYERKRIFDFLHPAFIYKTQNLSRSYEAYEAAAKREEEVYTRAKALVEEGEGSFEAALSSLGGAEEQQARDLWMRLKKETEARVEEFFVLENKFLEVYKTQVSFLQERAGLYHFVDKKIVFSKVEDTAYYSKLSNILVKISERQFRILLKQNLAAR